MFNQRKRRVSGTLLPCSSGPRRQLKHYCLLTFHQIGQEDELPVWEFQRIVMRRRALFVDLPKDRRSVTGHLPAPAQQSRRSALDRICKRQFGARQNANSNPSTFRGSKPTGTGAKVPRGQLVANPRRS